MSQRRWGSTRCRKFLARNHISEVKQVGSLTQRQRSLLAEQLEETAPAAEDDRRTPGSCGAAPRRSRLKDPVSDRPRAGFLGAGPIRSSDLNPERDRAGPGKEEEPHCEGGQREAGAHHEHPFEHEVPGVIESAGDAVGAVHVAELGQQ